MLTLVWFTNCMKTNVEVRRIQIKSNTTISISKDPIGKGVVWLLNTTCHAIIQNGFCSLISKGPRKPDLALQLFDVKNITVQLKDL